MPIVFHILMALAYIALSIVVAFALPQIAAGVSQGLAFYIAGGVLLIGALGHQAIAHLSGNRRLADLLNSIHAENLATRDQADATRAKLSALASAIGLGHAVEIASENRAAAEQDDSKSEGELKLLRTLLDQLPNEVAENVRAEADEAAPVAAAGGSASATVADTLLRAAADYARDPVPPKSDYRADWVGDGGRPEPADQPLTLKRELEAEAEKAGDSAREPRPPTTPGQTTVQPSLVSRRQPADSNIGNNATDILETTRDALERARVSVFLQPIVQLPNRRVTFYEAYSRIRDRGGNLIGPHSYLEMAERAGLIAAIDNNLLFRCVQLLRRVRRFNRDIGFFCNVSAHTLMDETFFPQFIEFLADNTELAEDLVFEFSQADIEGQWDDVGESIERLAELGFRFSLDQVDNLSIDLRMLTKRHFGFVKLDAGMMLQVLRQPDGARARLMP